MKKYFHVVIMLMTLSYHNSNAQNNKVNLFADFTLSGTGHGRYAGLGVSYKKNMTRVDFIPLVQLERRVVNSFALNISKTLSRDLEKDWEDDCTRFRPWLFCSFQYYHAASLSKLVLQYELNIAEGLYPGMASPKINTIQFTAGMGGNFRIYKTVSIRTYLAIGFYDHLNLKLRLYHEKAAPILSLGIGVYLAMPGND